MSSVNLIPEMEKYAVANMSLLASVETAAQDGRWYKTKTKALSEA